MKNTIASRFAYAAAAFFVVGLVVSIGMRPPEGFEGAPPLSVVLTTVAFLIYHLAMLPVIAALPSPAWAKASGFAWVVVDNVLEMVSLFGEGAELIVPMRWGIHLATATWILGASWTQAGAFRWVGVLVTLAMTGITFAGPFIADRAAVPQTLGPAALLFIVWIVMAGRQLGKSDAVTQ
jgi:hypothetical protein